MTARLIDLLCGRHRSFILDTRLWPADCPINGTFGAYLDCRDCDNARIPGHLFDDAEKAAVHEAGHAVMYVAAGADVEYAVLNPGQRDSGQVRFSGSLSRDEFLTGTWGGVAATLHWADRMLMLDDAAVVDLVVCGYGDLQFALDHVSDFGGRDADRAYEQVGRHWDAVECVADALLAAGRLSGSEIAGLAGIGVPA